MTSNPSHYLSGNLLKQVSECFYGDFVLISDHKGLMIVHPEQKLSSAGPLTPTWRSRRCGEPGRPSWVAGLGPSSFDCSNFMSSRGWSPRKRVRSALPSSRTSTGWVAVQFGCSSGQLLWTRVSLFVVVVVFIFYSKMCQINKILYIHIMPGDESINRKQYTSLYKRILLPVMEFLCSVEIKKILVRN